MLGELWADFVRFCRGIGAFFALFTGGISWSPPPWLRVLGRGIAALFRWAASNRRSALAVTGAVLLVAGGGSWVSRWYKSRPHPVELTVEVREPGLTDFENDGKPDPVRFVWNGGAAPIAAVRKEVASGVELSPRLPGAFRWLDDRVLEFTPRADWPVGQRFTVTFARKGFFAETARPARYQVEFASRPFSIVTANAEFYQDPTDPKLKKVVATYHFSHPVDTGAFESRLRATLLQKGDPADKGGRPLQLRVTYDKWKGQAFVHSEPIAVPERDATAQITVDKGVRAQRGGPPTAEPREEKVAVPGLYSFLKVSSLSPTIVDNERGEPDQVLLVETTIAVSESEIRSHLSAFLLPEYAAGEEGDEERKNKTPHQWSSPALVGSELLKPQSAVKLEAIASEKEYDTVHSFRFRAPPGRWLYVRVDKGLAGFGGYLLAMARDESFEVPAFPAALKLVGQGALLSMTGQRKVSVYARDIPAVRFEVGRVLPNQLQHLVTQSSGRFQRPSLGDYRFGADNISEIFTETQRLPPQAPGKPAYLALDLARYFDAPGGAPRRGLFLLHARAFDADRNVPLDQEDQRLLLLTDLGIVVKDADDGHHDVFVQSIHGGDPVAGARVELLGKNGLPVMSATTDERGHAVIGDFSRLSREKSAALYLVSKGEDQSFLPVGRYDRYLDVSRFDVGGVHERAGTRGLSAFLFSDRGIYRPGDEIRGGLIVKSDGWKQGLEGVPIQLTVTDARGVVVQTRTVKLDEVGFRELRHATQETSPTGTWTLSAYVVDDGKPGALLGSTTVRVREFLPDRMKIRARLSAEAARGWVSPGDLKGLVSLENLYGTAAEAHAVRGRLVLTPGLPPVGAFRDYTFFDPLRAKESFTDDLAEQKTDDKGQATFDFKLSRFTGATYHLHFLAEGFEAEGGRSVSADAEVTVSPLPFLLGWKADGDLGYVGKGSRRTVEVVAISPRAEAVAAPGLKAVLLQRKYVSVLVRQPNDTFKYESIRRDLPIGEKAISVEAGGTKQVLATDKPGDFAWVIQGEKGEELLRVEYTVAGQGNLARSLEKDAELQLSLKSRDVEPGAPLELQIKAPYVGAGLITIERDKVYAWKWFKSDTTATVQTITVPPELEGGGYVSVSFLRDINSEDVFMSPLSYGVAPFSISRARRTAKVTVEAPELVRPGDTLALRYRADRASKIVVYAVDEGILRVAGYHAPDPLGFFFQKRSLEVRTGQILDLVLPEYDRLMAAAAPGGDGEGLLAAHLNPFKRRRDKPVAFWSGILDAGPDAREVKWQVPDSFNGSLRIMAVTVSAGAIGTVERTTTVRGDFVISPNVPTFAAPGDTFDVTVGVANNVVGSGKDARVALSLATSPHVEIVGAAKVDVPAAELREGHATFRLRATQTLGSAALTFTAQMNGRAAKLVTDLSVRPPAPYLVTFAAGHLAPGASADGKVARTLYPEFRVQKAGIAHVPLGLAHGLAGYLEKFPHGCTEQLVSQGIPALALGRHPEFGYDRATAERSVQKVLEMLQTRQNSDGAFGLWAAGPHVSPEASAWAVLFLLEARERGFEVPAPLLKSALGWLQSVAGSPGETMADERLRAYATYLLTRSGMVTTPFVAALRKRLEAEHEKEWPADEAAAWLAGTYALLHDDRAARPLAESVKLGVAVEPDWAHYRDGLTRDAVLLYVMARHFPERARRLGPADLNAIARPIFDGTVNTLSAASAILALEAYAGAAAAADANGFAAFEINGTGARKPLALPANLLPWADLSGEARAVHFEAGPTFPAYWLVSQAGFDTQPPDKPLAQRLEVFREYTDAAGKAVTRVGLGDEIQVHVRVRALSGTVHSLALVDLLPGGFEVVVRPDGALAAEPAGDDRPAHRRAPRGDGEGDGDGEGEGGGDGEGEGDGEDHETEGEGEAAPFALPIALAGTTLPLDYGDVREDRVVLYSTIGSELREFVYAIKAVSAGTFAVAPILGESLYDRGATARGVGGQALVVEPRAR